MSFTPLHVSKLRDVLALPSAATKVAIYLASRSDAFGMSFPSISTIASECWMSIASVYRGMAILKANDLVRVVRENARDAFTGKPVPNVYMLTDSLIVIRPECRDEYNALWGHRGSGERDDSHHGYTNQQQNQIHEPNTEDQIQKPTTTTSEMPLERGDDVVLLDDNTQTKSPDMHDAGEKSKSKKAKNRNTQTKSQDTPPGSARPPQSGKSPSPFKTGYIDPDAIQGALLDSDESVAVNIANLGIPMELSRGFVLQYGADLCNSSLGVVRQQRDSTNPPGLFRYLIQKRLTVIKTQSQLEGGDRYTGGKYADFVES